MPNKTIVLEPLQKRFTVSVKDANRQKRNRYYSNASPCCNVRLKQERKCSACEELVESSEVTHKIVKLGGDEHLIEAAALKNVEQELNKMEDVRIHTILNDRPEGAEDRFDSLLYAKPATKHEGDYAELAQILKDRVAVATAVIRKNEYQLLIEVGDDGVLRLRKLVEEGQRYEFNPEEIQQATDGKLPAQEIIELENAILDKKTTTSYDITEFRDTRSEYEEHVIEEFILNGTTPQAPTENFTTKAQESELERLKALMEEQ